MLQLVLEGVLAMDLEKMERAVGLFLESVGENLKREGIDGTPKRVVKYFSTFTPQNPLIDAEYPKKFVKLFLEASLVGKEQLVEVSSIPFFTFCEHHLLPFFGTVDISYIPSEGKILGLSKFGRIVEYFSKKFQNQERITDQIANFVFSNIPSKGVRVVARAQHMCMIARGIKALGSETKTEVVKGEI